ncbi:hypothetical protein COLSTE_01369 [Collinsella stercoris DSM 13279]|uniref:Uncharacterized protein n=1 Tax=Collinsella stercoris DSM 13279 TaxID=445975 RepID=B6GBB1_9ACTN|nr:hypothetical protein COLSTE_01369 [Collinsella stercoris DSM 13279]
MARRALLAAQRCVPFCLRGSMNALYPTASCPISRKREVVNGTMRHGVSGEPQGGQPWESCCSLA